MGFKHTVTNLPAENEYPKLVRDRIPEIIKNNDGLSIPTKSIANDEEFLTYLLKKIVEEAEELSEATTDSNIAEEIADLYEVVDALLKLKDMSRSDIVAVQNEKREKRGGFDQRLLMLEKRQ